MREIVIDTETTGLDPKSGDRIVEIACVELLHHVPTGKRFHRYINPERDMPEGAFAVHGLTSEFLAKHSTFDAVAEEMLAFIGEDCVVIHNAEFDLAFLNMELSRLNRPAFGSSYVDTLSMARRRFPGAPASLDALCRRFSIDLTSRELHGAAIDCALLAEVYIELLGGRQPGLDFAVAAMNGTPGDIIRSQREPRAPRPHMPTLDELAAHQAMLATIKSPIWSLM